jgi:tetratricopeptide (TPR) repeat protein
MSGYLCGNLDSKTLLRVEHHLLDCELCSDAVDGFNEFDLTHTSSHLPNTFAELTSEKKNEKRPVASIRPITRNLLRVAAIGSIALVSYLTFFRGPSLDQLYSKYYSVYQADIPVSSRGTEQTDLNLEFEQGIIEYNKGDFQKSLDFFQNALYDEGKDPVISFFAGLACMEIKQFEKAIGYLNITKEADSLYSTKATWYIALSYLKLGEIEKASEQLDELIEEGSFKVVEAQRLKSKLN